MKNNSHNNNLININEISGKQEKGNVKWLSQNHCFLPCFGGKRKGKRKGKIKNIIDK